MAKTRITFENALKNDEIDQIIHAATENKTHQTMLILLKCSGMRVSELHNLHIRYFNPRELLIDIPVAKRGKQRQILITQEAATALSYYIDYHKAEIEKREAIYDRNVEAKRKELEKIGLSGKSLETALRAYMRTLPSPFWNITIRGIQKMIKNYGLKVGIEKPSGAHQFRYNYVTTALKYMPVHQVSKLCGHENVDTTIRCYDKSVPIDYREGYTKAFEIMRINK